MTTIKRILDVELKELTSQRIQDWVVERDGSLRLKDGDKVVAVVEPYHYWCSKLETLGKLTPQNQ